MMNYVYIFGAHSRALTTAKYITTIEPATKIAGFLFNDDQDNLTEIDAIPVINIHSNEKDNLNVNHPVYIATRSDSWGNICSDLMTIGFTDIRPVDVSLDSKLRNEYLKIDFASQNKPFIKIEDLKFDGTSKECACNSIIFSCVSVNDRELETGYKLADYEEPMQVGTTLSAYKMEEILGKKVSYHDDDYTDNIASLNKQFCELTGLYSLWKMDKNIYDYVGLCHYRRHFILYSEWQQALKKHDIDVVLPVPLYVHPSLEDNYRFRHISSDLEYVFSYIEENYDEMYESVREFFRQGLYSPCNMLIAKPEVINDLCAWLFPILMALYRNVGKRDDIYQNRYPGFVSERLISFFFEYYKAKYNLVYADKVFVK